MNGTPDPRAKYEAAARQRQACVEAVLNSPSTKKIVVGGPGTGKTFLFKKLLEPTDKSLTLTFVNSLVEDLSLELCGLSEVKTLHAFARGILGAVAKDAKVFPKLSAVIREDATILIPKDIDFDTVFHNRDDNNEHIPFYRGRKDYYKHYGFADIVFAAVKLFEAKPQKIPAYEQIVVDEFQDFNKLEVSLIDLLATKSPVLLAGDDDQALYAFKSASTEHIRQRHSDKKSGYTSFNLPYCSRCSRVIVQAANDIIAAAKQRGHLKGRIEKPYVYFEDPRKDKESAQNPKIIYAQVFAKQIPWFIEQRIGELAEQVKGKFSVLIISPTKTQSRMIADALRNKGLENIDAAEKHDLKEPTLLDGLKLLLNDRKCNLGWRIVCKSLLPEAQFQSMLKQTCPPNSKNFSEIASRDLKRRVASLLKVLRQITGDEQVDEQELSTVLKTLGLDPHQMTRDHLKEDIASNSRPPGNPSIRKIPIKATTIQSSKGLAAEYVFITNFDDQYFVANRDKSKISDQNICNFLVALTRAKRRVFLVSSDTKKQPAFLQWISPGHIEVV
ncbi:MAG: UvrD-helicase domain-containing protein [Verrucomicrobiota bacterium]|jgi:hypothetical protein